MHGDQTHGINDLRPFYLSSKKQINVYADRLLQNILKKVFHIYLTVTRKNILLLLS